MNRFEFSFMKFDKIMVGLPKPEDVFIQNESLAPYADIVDYYGKEDKKVEVIKKRNKKTEVLDNSVVSGFKIVRSMSRNGVSGSFDIYDPRGFIVKGVTPFNIMHLTLNAKIEDGEILNPCFWTRTGGYMFLLPANSEIENAYLREVELKNNQSLKNYKKGDVVVLHNGFTGTFMGTVVFEPAFYASKPFNSNTYGEDTYDLSMLPAQFGKKEKQYILSTSYVDHICGMPVVKSRINLFNKISVKEVVTEDVEYKSLKKEITNESLLKIGHYNCFPNYAGTWVGRCCTRYDSLATYQVYYQVKEKDI